MTQIQPPVTFVVLRIFLCQTEGRKSLDGSLLCFFPIYWGIEQQAIFFTMEIDSLSSFISKNWNQKTCTWALLLDFVLFFFIFFVVFLTLFTPQVLLNDPYRNIANEPMLKGNIHLLSATIYSIRACKWDWSLSQQGWLHPDEIKFITQRTRLLTCISLEYWRRRNPLSTQPRIRPGTNAVTTHCEETVQLVKYRVIWQ